LFDVLFAFLGHIGRILSAASAPGKEKIRPAA